MSLHVLLITNLQASANLTHMAQQYKERIRAVFISVFISTNDKSVSSFFFQLINELDKNKMSIC